MTYLKRWQGEVEKRLRLDLTWHSREKILKRSSNEIFLGHSTGGRHMRRYIPIKFFFLPWISIQVLLIMNICQYTVVIQYLGFFLQTIVPIYYCTICLTTEQLCIKINLTRFKAFLYFYMIFCVVAYRDECQCVAVVAGRFGQPLLVTYMQKYLSLNAVKLQHCLLQCALGLGCSVLTEHRWTKLQKTECKRSLLIQVYHLSVQI